MQKKIIALAVAGLMSGAAFAQSSNVTMYGVADMYYGHVQAPSMTAKTANAFTSGGLAGSRIGFKGTEDLGNGNKAIFVLEYGLQLDTNSGLGDFSGRTAPVNGWGGAQGYNTNAVGTNNTARQQIVGLTGNWGTAVAGYAQTAGYDWACAVDPLAGSALDTSSKMAGQMLLNCGKGGRASNAVAYISPSFGGFSAAVNFAMGENNAGQDLYKQDKAYLVAANYTNGPVDVRFVYSNAGINTENVLTTGNVYNVNNTTTANIALAGGTDIKEIGIGGSFDLGVAKIFASYQTLNADILAGTNKTLQVGVSAPVGPGVLAASYAKSTLSEINQAFNGNFNDSSYAIAYIYPMSKRTKLYGGFNQFNNDDDSSRIATGLTPTAGGHTRTYAVGINHAF